MPFSATLLYLLAWFSAITIPIDEPHDQNEWQTIFNGRNLDGWRIKISHHPLDENYRNTFRVEDGKLIVSYNEYDEFNGQFGHIFYDEKLSHFKLRLQYRFVGEQLAGAPEWGYKNSGIKFHAPPPEEIPVDMELLVAIEAQLLGGNGKDDRPTGNVCTAGTHIEMDGELRTQHCINSSSHTFHGEEWVTAEIEVHGNDRVIHRINGKEVLSYEHPQLDDSDEYAQKLMAAGMPRMLSEGYIALQAESHPVEFRSIQLMRLPNE